jgi:hypothetical protein
VGKIFRWEIHSAMHVLKKERILVKNKKKKGRAVPVFFSVRNKCAKDF